MLAAYAMAEGCEFAIYMITGDRHVDILGNPTAVEWGMLAILAATLPLAAIVGWLVTRLSGSRTRTIAAAVGVAFAGVVGYIEDGPPHLLGTAAAIRNGPHRSRSNGTTACSPHPTRLRPPLPITASTC
jgi:hypothetical protein